MIRLSLAVIFLSSAWGQNSGIHPRPDANSYPASAHIPGATLAAAALSSAQVKSAFGTDVYKGYIVLEVAIFPDPSENLKVSPNDFFLKVGGGDFLRPSAPATIANEIDEKNNPTYPPDVRRPVDVTTTSTIGYDSAGVYDPNTGKRHGVVYAGTEVAVGPGGSMGRNPTPSASKGRGFDAMEAELSGKELPEGTVSRPQAGYLYFLPPKKKVSGVYELEYSGDSGRVKLSIPPPAR
jgi:hypothetical protein